MMSRPFVVPTGFQDASLLALDSAIRSVLERLYRDIPLPDQPVTNKHVSKAERNAGIRARYAAGETLQEIAGKFGDSIE